MYCDRSQIYSYFVTDVDKENGKCQIVHIYFVLNKLDDSGMFCVGETVCCGVKWQYNVSLSL